MVIVGSVLIVISGGSLILLYGLSARYDSQVGREDILDGVPAATDDEHGMNFLVLGTDSRADQETQSLEETGNRSDTIMIVHINKAKTGAFIVSIPRDSYVDIPASPGDWNGGKNKINAALVLRRSQPRRQDDLQPDPGAAPRRDAHQLRRRQQHGRRGGRRARLSAVRRRPTSSRPTTGSTRGGGQVCYDMEGEEARSSCGSARRAGRRLRPDQEPADRHEGPG